MSLGSGGEPRRLPAPACALLALALALAAGLLTCRPDPYALMLRTLEPGERVELPGDRTLTF